MNESEKLRKVAIQRDEIRKTLAELCDKLRHGVYNDIFPDKSNRAHSDDPNAKCKGGFAREDVLWRMGKCCQECDGIGNCHLSFEEKDVFKAMQDALSILNKPSAEMPEITPYLFERYIPESKYEKTPRQIARSLYKFCVGYWCYSDHSDVDAEKAWEKAFYDTLCIALDSIGRNGRSFRKFLEIAENKKIDEEAKKFVEEHPEIEEIIEDAVKSRDVAVSGEKDVGTLVMYAVLIGVDYQFAHDYPGGDMDVYGGVFESIIDASLKVAGLYPEGRPNSYDFDYNDEYERKLLEYEAAHKEALFKFMEEE